MSGSQERGFPRILFLRLGGRIGSPPLPLFPPTLYLLSPDAKRLSRFSTYVRCLKKELSSHLPHVHVSCEFQSCNKEQRREWVGSRILPQTLWNTGKSNPKSTFWDGQNLNCKTFSRFVTKKYSIEKDKVAFRVGLSDVCPILCLFMRWERLSRFIMSMHSFRREQNLRRRTVWISQVIRGNSEVPSGANARSPRSASRANLASGSLGSGPGEYLVKTLKNCLPPYFRWTGSWPARSWRHLADSKSRKILQCVHCERGVLASKRVAGGSRLPAGPRKKCLGDVNCLISFEGQKVVCLLKAVHLGLLVGVTQMGALGARRSQKGGSRLLNFKR